MNIGFVLQTVVLVAPPRLDSPPLRTVTLERRSIRVPRWREKNQWCILSSRVAAHPAAGELARTTPCNTHPLSMHEVMLTVEAVYRTATMDMVLPKK